MKKLLISVVLAVSSLGVLACPETKATAAVPVASAAEEKKEPETKRVCIKVLDNKTNKEVEKCRVMKIHEKREGTQVPTK